MSQTDVRLLVEHPLELSAPGCSLFCLARVGSPDVKAVEEEDPAQDRAASGLPEIDVIRQFRRGTCDEERLFFDGKAISLDRVGKNDFGGQVVAQLGSPRSEFSLVGFTNMSHNSRC